MSSFRWVLLICELYSNLHRATTQRLIQRSVTQHNSRSSVREVPTIRTSQTCLFSQIVAPVSDTWSQRKPLTNWRYDSCWLTAIRSVECLYWWLSGVWTAWRGRAFTREYVVHGDGEYADGDVHVNTCESHRSLVRYWPSPHRGVSGDKLTLYLRAFQLRRRVYRKPGEEAL